jgi:hypothetical protein
MAKTKKSKKVSKSKVANKGLSAIAKLKKMQAEWAEAEPMSGGGRVPDGEYTVRIDSAEIGEAKQSGRLQIHWAMTVVDPPEFVNKKLNKWDACDEPKDLPWIQGALETLELEIPEELADIGEVVSEAVGLHVNITVQTKDEFCNIYFNSIVDPDDIEELEDDEELEDEEEDDEELDSELEDDESDEDLEGEEEEEEEVELAEEDVLKMKPSALKDLIAEEELDINPKRYKSVASLRKAVVKALFD